MATVASIESILVVDCGSTITRVILLDLVDGRYRFIARGETFSTASRSENDLLIGVRQALQQIEEITGRVFLDDDGQLITPERPEGRGVDALFAVTNAGRPLRLILAGLSDQISLGSARRAVLSAYSSVEHTFSPEMEAAQKQTSENEISLIQNANADVIVLTGGIDGGPAGPLTDLAEMLTLGCALLDPSSRPQIMYAGNSTMREPIAGIVGSTTELVMLDNVRPSLDIENLEPLSSALNDLYQERQLSLLPGFNTLRAWASAPVATSSRAFGYVIKYLAQMWGTDHSVLGVDIGGSITTAAFVLDNEFSLINRADLGVTHALARVLAQSGVDNVLRWLPFEMDRETARDRLLNKQLRSSSLPETTEDLYLEQAVAREALRLTMSEARSRWQKDNSELCPEFEVIVGSGGVLAHAPLNGQVALILLDAVEPTGITTLWLDSTSLAVPVGALAAVHPLAAAQVMEGDAFLNLGTIISPTGTGSRPGDVIMRLTITYSDGRSLDVEIHHGGLEVIPLPLGEEARLEVRPLKGFDVGSGPGKKRLIKRLVGGMIGLVVDARGRPLVLPSDSTQRIEKVKQWYSDIGA